MSKYQNRTSDIEDYVGTAAAIKNYGVINKAEHFNLEEAKKVFNLCDENSIKFIDTAQAYGNAERIIGKFTDSKFKIITKIWLNENPSPKE